MKKKTWLIGGALALAGAALLAWAFAPRPLEVELAIAAAGRFERSIEEDGKTRVAERFVVSAPLAGRLARITLREGDAVAADAALATLTPVLAPLLDERSAREQAARVEAAQASLQRAGAGVERARVALAQARGETRRSAQLAGQGFVSPTKLETDRLGDVAAQKELEAAIATEHVAQHELQTARAALQVLRNPGTAAGGFVVRAPVAGRVLRLLQPSEATVALGTPLLELGDTAGLEIVAELLTADALQAVPGTPVRIERWGGAGELQGRVRRVEPSAFTKVSALGVEEQRVKVLVDLSSPPEQWRALGDGFRVALRLVVQAQEGALLVPVSAVFPRPGGDGAMAVFRVEGGRARLVPVTLGGRSTTHAWVQSGLAAGDAVIVYPPAAVADGARVKSRKV
jgi:HlyD family secretion protein